MHSAPRHTDLTMTYTCVHIVFVFRAGVIACPVVNALF